MLLGVRMNKNIKKTVFSIILSSIITLPMVFSFEYGVLGNAFQVLIDLMRDPKALYFITFFCVFALLYGIFSGVIAFVPAFKDESRKKQVKIVAISLSLIGTIGIYAFYPATEVVKRVLEYSLWFTAIFLAALFGLMIHYGWIGKDGTAPPWLKWFAAAVGLIVAGFITNSKDLIFFGVISLILAVFFGIAKAGGLGDAVRDAVNRVTGGGTSGANPVPNSVSGFTGRMGATGAELSWNANPAADAVTHYVIERRDRRFLAGRTTVATPTATDTTYIDTTAVRGRNYFYQIRAVNANGLGPRSHDLPLGGPSAHNNYLINGRVFDNATGHPIANSLVMIPNASHPTHTSNPASGAGVYEVRFGNTLPAPANQDMYCQPGAVNLGGGRTQTYFRFYVQNIAMPNAANPTMTYNFPVVRKPYVTTNPATRAALPPVPIAGENYYYW